LAGDNALGIDQTKVRSLAEEIAEVTRQGVQLGLVVGGVLPGAPRRRAMDRVTADHMGMLATVINAPRLAGRARKTAYQTRVMQIAIEMHQVAEPLYSPPRSPAPEERVVW
jgi:uridylate kinase